MLDVDTSLIDKAVNILDSGGLVAFPTETVYGLGADAANEAAVRRIFAAKERPMDHPLIVHLPSREAVSEWAAEITPEAERLMDAFWPGPLTLILPKNPNVSNLITAGQEKIGLRMPSHPVAQAILEAFGKGIAAPSANKFTHISPTTAEAVKEELGNEVDLILDGGICEVGVESTILDVSSDSYTVLRPGMITKEELEVIIGRPVSLVTQAGHSTVRAPGHHAVHYAPNTPTQVLSRDALYAYLDSLMEVELPIAVVVYEPGFDRKREGVHVVNMPPRPDGYAHELYHALRSLDHLQVKQIIIEDVPNESAWQAIRDRIAKASGRE